jgi:hypothetical protein
MSRGRGKSVQMMVKCPPLPLSSQDEYTLFNTFIWLHLKPMDSDFQALAKEFKAKANCTNIFPKLPSMLKVHSKKCKDTNLINTMEVAMKKVYNELLQRLAIPVVRETQVLQAVEGTLAAMDTGDGDGPVATGTNDNEDSEHNDGNGPAVPLDVGSDEELQKP